MPRARSPLKRKGHVIVDMCTPEGEVAREVVSKAKFSSVFSTARKATWGGLWPSDMSEFYGVERTEDRASEVSDSWEEQQRALLERFGSTLEIGEEDEEEDGEDEQEEAETFDLDALQAKALEYGIDMSAPTTNNRRKERRKRGRSAAEAEELELEFERGGAGIPTGDAMREMSNADFLAMVSEMHGEDFDEGELGDEGELSREDEPPPSLAVRQDERGVVAASPASLGAPKDDDAPTPSTSGGGRRRGRRRRRSGAGLRKG